MADNNNSGYETITQLKEAAGKANRAVEDGIAATSHAVKRTTALARNEYQQATTRAQTFLDTGIAHYKAAEEQIFSRMKEGVERALAHPMATYSALGALAVLTIPGTRRILWRQTFGRLRSEEAILASAEARAKHLAEAVDAHSAEANKLNQRLAAAQEQYDSGLSKLKATSRQLLSLSSQVSATQKSANTLIASLRELPSKQALALRSATALQAAAARRQQAALDRQLLRLSRQGI